MVKGQHFTLQHSWARHIGLFMTCRSFCQISTSPYGELSQVDPARNSPGFTLTVSKSVHHLDLKKKPSRLDSNSIVIQSSNHFVWSHCHILNSLHTIQFISLPSHIQLLSKWSLQVSSIAISILKIRDWYPRLHLNWENSIQTEIKQKKTLEPKAKLEKLKKTNREAAIVYLTAPLVFHLPGFFTSNASSLPSILFIFFFCCL